MSECRATPISFLLLERYLLEEVSAQERQHVKAHLAECEACRACFDALRNDAMPLAPMPALIGLARLRRGLKPLPATLSMLAMAAIVMLLVRLGSPSEDPIATHGASSGGATSVKGGELAMELVRAHGSEIGVDATKFVVGDKFAVRVTCDPSTQPYWDVVVFQGDQASFPLSPSERLSCGNRVTLPGAFMLTEDKRARVCVLLDDRAPIARVAVTPKLSQRHACLELRAVH